MIAMAGRPMMSVRRRTVASMNGADRHIEGQQRQEALHLPPFAEPDRIAELAIMAATRRSLVDGHHAELTDQRLGLIDAVAIRDVENLFQPRTLSRVTPPSTQDPCQDRQIPNRQGDGW